MSSSALRKKHRPKDPIKAYKKWLREGAKPTLDPFLEKVANAIAFSRQIYRRGGSEVEKRLAIAFNTFPRTIVRAASHLRSILRRRLDRPNMLRLGREIGRLVDDEMGRARAEFPAPPSACRQGCHFCCHLPVETTVPQVLVIADHLRDTLDPAQMQDLRSRMDDYEARVASHPSGKGLALCPLNVDGACSVYEVRPTICRSFNSSDAAACERAMEKEWESPIPIDYAPIGAEVAVQAGYQIAGLVHGHPYRAVPLVPALRQALDHPERFRVEDFEKSSDSGVIPEIGGGVR